MKGTRKSTNVVTAKPLSAADKRRRGFEELRGEVPTEVLDQRMRRQWENDRAIRFKNRHTPPNPLRKASGVDSMKAAEEAGYIKSKQARKAAPKGPRNPFKR